MEQRLSTYKSKNQHIVNALDGKMTICEGSEAIEKNDGIIMNDTIVLVGPPNAPFEEYIDTRFSGYYDVIKVTQRGYLKRSSLNYGIKENMGFFTVQLYYLLMVLISTSEIYEEYLLIMDPVQAS